MLVRWSYLFNVWIWPCFIFSSVFHCFAQQAGSLQNISISNTAPQLDYTPFVCNVAGSASFSSSCLGGWQILTVGGETIVTTQGAGPLGANIVPQMFLRFQASALLLTFSPTSNATVDISVSAGSTFTSASVNSSVGVAALLNLPNNETTTLGLTFVPGQISSHLDIGNFTAEVTDSSIISSILPTQTLPPTVSIPTFTPTTSAASSSTTTPSSTSQASHSDHKQLVADAVGLTLGLGLGLTLFSVIGFYIWKRRRRRQQEDGDAEWRYSGDAQGQGQHGNFALRRTDNQDSTRWF